MCKMASGFINPQTFEVRVAALDSHSDTADKLGLKDGPEPNWWREMHYTPEGEIECRVLDIDAHSSEECEAAVAKRWPTFLSFLAWAARHGATASALSLKSLTSAEGLVLPDGVAWLNLDGLTSAEGLVLPEGVRELSLDGLTSAEGLVLPEGVRGLYLDGLTSAEGLVLPEGVRRLSLDGLTSAEGLVLPEGVRGLYLDGLTSAEGLVLPEGVGCYVRGSCYESAALIRAALEVS